MLRHPATVRNPLGENAHLEFSEALMEPDRSIHSRSPFPSHIHRAMSVDDGENFSISAARADLDRSATDPRPPRRGGTLRNRAPDADMARSRRTAHLAAYGSTIAQVPYRGSEGLG